MRLPEDTKGTSPYSGGRSALLAVRFLLGGLLVVLLFGWLIQALRRLDPVIGISIPAWLQRPGLALIVLGGSIVVVCTLLFAAFGRGTPSPLEPTEALVIRGPYRYVRNPIHIGQVALLAGLALWLRSFTVLLLASAWLLFCHLYVVVVEEPGLAKRFGVAYEDYRRAVPRWAPKYLFHGRQEHRQEL